MSQRDRALDAIREVILSGRIRPGEKTSERKLTETFLGGTDLGRTPVREALAVLTEQGVVEQYPQVGFAVRVVDASEARKVLALQRITEGVMVAEAARRRVDTQALARLDDGLREAAARGKADQSMNLLRSLHVTLATAAGYDSAAVALGGFRDRLTLFFVGTAPLRDRELTDVAAHAGQLVDAISADASGDKGIERLDKLIEIEASLVAAREAAREADLLDAGRLSIEPKTEDLVSIVATALGQARALTARYPMRLNAPARLMAFVDSGRIEECVGQMLVNAIKFSEPGRPIDVELSALREGAVQLAVRDHGIGLSVAQRARVFERSFQADRTSLGGGIGLYLCQRVIQRLGGSIDVQAPTDGGSRFEIMLPAPVAEAGREPALAGAAAARA